MAQTLIIDDETRNKRLDMLAVSVLPTLSRAFVQRLIEEDKITVNGKHEKPGYRLRLDDQVVIDFEVEELDQIEYIDLPILFQDDDVLVINKPVGVISHSRGKYWYEPSVASFVRQITGQPGDRAGIVHRLDRATSGVMICAKNTETLSWLQKQFSQRNVKKTYIAVVDGHLKPEQAIIDMPIERNPKVPATFRVGANGKEARTQYKVLEQSKQYDLVELQPETGRTHQLRVHLQHQGHTIIGDPLYGSIPAERMYLHAHSLELTLPGGKRVTFESPVPKEFKQLLKSDHE